MSDVSGVVRVEEVDNFAQEDLIDEDCMLLDTYSQVGNRFVADASIFPPPHTHAHPCSDRGSRDLVTLSCFHSLVIVRGVQGAFPNC